MTYNIKNLYGKKAHYYSSFNSENADITIKSVSLCEDSLRLEGPGYWGNEQHVYVPYSIIANLLLKGKATIEYEIDHCYLHDDYSIEL